MALNVSSSIFCQFTAKMYRELFDMMLAKNRQAPLEGTAMIIIHDIMKTLFTFVLVSVIYLAPGQT
jgi:hypothetical protein